MEQERAAIDVAQSRAAASGAAQANDIIEQATALAAWRKAEARKAEKLQEQQVRASADAVGAATTNPLWPNDPLQQNPYWHPGESPGGVSAAAAGGSVHAQLGYRPMDVGATHITNPLMPDRKDAGSRRA